MRMLSGMIGQMTPEAQKRNLHRIFTRIELNDQGEAVWVAVKPWVMRAFGPMLEPAPVYRTYYAEGGSRGVHSPIGATRESSAPPSGNHQGCCAFYFSAFSTSPPEIKLAPSHECAHAGSYMVRGNASFSFPRTAEEAPFLFPRILGNSNHAGAS
jgi:hypothetical protein